MPIASCCYPAAYGVADKIKILWHDIVDPGESTVRLAGASKTNFFTPAGRAGIIAAAKNDLAPETMLFDNFRIDAGAPVNAHPTITASRPDNNDIAVSRDAFVSLDVRLPTVGATIDN